MSWRFWLFVIVGGVALFIVMDAGHRAIVRELEAHNCKPTGRHRWGGMTVIVQADGTTIPITLPDEYEWQCDDGVRWL